MNSSKMEGLSHAIIKILQFLFFGCIGFVCVQVLFHNTSYQYHYGIVAAVILVLLCLFYFFYNGLKSVSINNQKMRMIMVVYLVCFAIVQLVIAKRLEFVPAYDMGSVYHSAIQWLENGELSSDYEYFYYFPNNLGLLIVLRILFAGARFLGCTDYFFVGSLAGCASVILMMWAVIQICRKLLGNKAGLCVMLFMAVTPPFYVLAAVFYSDVMSIATIPLAIYFYLKAEEQTSIKRKIGWFLILAVVMAVGMKIKFTTSIGLIALFLIIVIKKQWKHASLLLVTVGIAVGIVFSASHHAVYPNLLNEKLAKNMNTPYLHWIMMGLQNDGTYHAADYQFTRSFFDVEQRQKALKEEIQNRIMDKKVSGMLELYGRKTTRCFGNGTFAASDFFADSPVNETKLHDYVLYDAPKYQQYSSICQGVFLFLMLCMLWEGIQSFFLNKERGKEIEIRNQVCNRAIFKLAFIGIWMFLMLWETSGRYFLNHVSVMYICGIFGMIGFFERCDSLKKKSSQ